MSSSRRFLADLDLLVRARYPLLYVVSWEEQRLDDALAELATRHGKQLLTWSITRGLRRAGGARAATPVEAVTEPLATLQAIERLSEPSLVVLKDFHAFLDEPKVVRGARELALALRRTFTTVVLLGPVLKIPPELEKDVTVLDAPLPGAAELGALLRDVIAVVRQGERAAVELNQDEAHQLVRAAQGLTLAEAENAFAKAIASDGKLAGDDIDLVLEEKRQVVRKGGLLEYFPPEQTLAGVGGLAHLKTWLDRRGAAFGDDARRFGLPEPKGLLLLGVQGCGKSLTAKAIAARWHLPLLRLDMGRIFAGYIGSSEENLRRAIRAAEGVAPVVLWIDEIDKGLAGTGSSDSSDGGTTARVFGALLTWMQEKTAPVFVVATANRIEGLPPELLRKGRFDEIFFIDLPGAEERAEIFAIHLGRRGRVPAAFDVAALATRARGYSGAEIEQAVVAALYDAFDERVELTQAHLERALADTRPLSTTMREEIARLRAWAASRTRPASPPEAEPDDARPGGA
ncbi:MAG: AAA family ATPase [Kofleriaceae bacterium]